MTYWIISDTHFGHDMLKKRGHRPDDFEEKIIKNLSNQVKRGDIVIHLGDFAFYKLDEWRYRFLNACYLAESNVLVRGNHDKQTDTWYMRKGWDFVCESFTLKKYGRVFLFTHVPISSNLLAMTDDNTVNIHGHLHYTNHRNAQTCDKHRLIKMEHNYCAVNLQRLI